jgi:uncharacterized RDD family membrane protein YckC
MDEQLTISTPEQVTFEYEMAGIGSRFVAALLDHVIVAAILLFLLCAGSFVGQVSLFASGGDAATAYLILAILILIIFLVMFGYFVVFETVWHGQTPGKRAGRLRVIRHNGQPIGAGEAMIRNLVRLADFLPVFYGIGFISMFIDKEARRLGDFAAGTIVVREGEQTRLHDVRVAPPAYTPTYSGQPPQPTYVTPTSSDVYAAGFGQVPPPASMDSTSLVYRVPAPRPDPLPGISLREVTPEDFALMRELLARVHRRELAWERGQDLAARMAYAIAARMGQDFAQWQANGWQPLVFLQSLLEARDIRGQT